MAGEINRLRDLATESAGFGNLDPGHMLVHQTAILLLLAVTFVIPPSELGHVDLRHDKQCLVIYIPSATCAPVILKALMPREVVAERVSGPEELIVAR